MVDRAQDDSDLAHLWGIGAKVKNFLRLSHLCVTFSLNKLVGKITLKRIPQAKASIFRLETPMAARKLEITF